jgi:DNA polymerase-1
MPTLYIIDGYAAFFRCYHAIRTSMTSPVTKEPTNMTFGFVGMLIKMLRAEGANIQASGGKPDYLMLALDVGGDRGTFRSQIYPDYKANRDAPPEDLQPQVERCLSMLKTIGVPVIGVPGFEADDVIATMVEKLGKDHPDVHIRIVSKDKDLKQLLEGQRVQLFDVHTDSPFSESTLLADLGLRPDQVVDMLSLMGDTADNVPGVDGVGEKTAAKLIKEFGTLEALLERVGEVKTKIGPKIAAAKSTIPLSKSLIVLRRDVPFDFNLESAKVGSLRLDQMIPLLKELGFNRYQDDIRSVINSGSQAAGSNSGEASPGSTAAVGAPRRRSSAPDPMIGGLFDTATRGGERELIRPQEGEYACVATLDALWLLAAEMRGAKCVAIDTETTALSPHTAKLCGISVSLSPGRGYYIPVRSPSPASHLDQAAVIGELRSVLEDASVPKCGHNLKFDINIFRSCGVTLRGLCAPGGCDSMVASYLIDASRSSHSLDALALALLGRTNISLSQLIGSGKDQKTFDTVPTDQATLYAAEDADVTLRLRDAMQPRIEADGMDSLLHDVELPLVEVLADLEYRGIIVDGAELDRQRERLQAKIVELKAQIESESREKIGWAFDPESPRQLATALFNKPTDETPGLGIKPTKRTKTGYSTDAEVLEEIAQDDSVTTPIPKLILEYRQLTKLVSTYLVALKDAIHPATGRVHTSFNQTVTATGRLASSDPNLQNIPIRTDVGRDIRRAFIAPPGHVLITADYSQIELRLLAHLSGDPALIEAFKRDEDIHTAVAAQIHSIPPEAVTRDQRSGAKMVNFGIVYGITAFGLSRRLRIPQDQAAAIIDGYKRKFAGITTFLQECIEQARSRGYVETMLKRRRPIPDAHSSNPSKRALAERLAINTVVQGSAADLIKLAMVRLHREINQARPGDPLSGSAMLLQIHDELVFETPTDRADDAMRAVVAGMEGAMSISVPLKVDAHAGRTWFEGK